MIKKMFKGKNNINEIKESIPKVIFDDLQWQITVGFWLGVISPQHVYKTFSPKKSAQSYTISKRKAKEIAVKFGQLLSSIGIDKTETCIFFSNERSTFKCYFGKKNKNVDITLKMESWFSPAEFIIDDNTEKRSYEYYKENEDYDAELLPQSIVIKNSSGYTFRRQFFTYYAKIFLENEDYTLQINIDRPNSIKKYDWDRYVFKLNNEDELKNYLLGLTFPMDIKEVYKKIIEISLNSSKEYPNLELKIINRKTSKIIDTIYFSYGNLHRFTTTKDDKIITVDSEGSWSCESPKFSINNKDNQIEYYVKVPTEEISSLSTPFEQYNSINEEVEKVRLSAKKI